MADDRPATPDSLPSALPQCAVILTLNAVKGKDLRLLLEIPNTAYFPLADHTAKSVELS